jgi:hypothetical protein
LLKLTIVSYSDDPAANHPKTTSRKPGAPSKQTKFYVACGKTAKVRYSACYGSPTIDLTDTEVTCRKAHWSEHKPSCRCLGQRKTPVCVAEVVAAVWEIVRLELYDRHWRSVELQGIKLLFTKGNHQPREARPYLLPFPEDQFHDRPQNIGDAALFISASQEAVIYLGHLLQVLLEGEPFDFFRW